MFEKTSHFLIVNDGILDSIVDQMAQESFYTHNRILLEFFGKEGNDYYVGASILKIESNYLLPLESSISFWLVMW